MSNKKYKYTPLIQDVVSGKDTLKQCQITIEGKSKEVKISALFAPGDLRTIDFHMGFQELPVKVKFKAVKKLYKFMAKNLPEEIDLSEAGLMFPIYSDEKDAVELMKLFDDAGFGWYDDAEQGIGTTELGPDDKPRTAYWFADYFGDIADTHGSNKAEKKLITMMNQLIEMWQWGDYRFYIDDNYTCMGGEVVVGGLHQAEQQELDTAHIWIDFDGKTAAEFDTKCFDMKVIKNLQVYDKVGLKAIMKAVKERKFKTADELGIS